MRRRPPRRQPGPHRSDVARAQEEDVRAPRRDGLQGDRGRLPVRLPDGLRLRAHAHRGGHDPRWRRHPGADPVARAPHRAHLRGDPRRQAGDRAPLQLHVDPAATRRLRPRQGGHQGHRRAWCAVVQEVRRADRRRDRGLLRVLPRVLHRHGAGIRRRGLRCGDRGVAAHPRPQGDPQSARHGGDGHPQCVRRLDRVDAPPSGPPRQRRALTAPAQRSGHGRRCRRAGLHGRS